MSITVSTQNQIYSSSFNHSNSKNLYSYPKYKDLKKIIKFYAIIFNFHNSLFLKEKTVLVMKQYIILQKVFKLHLTLIIIINKVKFNNNKKIYLDGVLEYLDKK